MQDDYSEQQWLLYIDGLLDSDVASQMQRHIDTCLECRAFVSSMLEVREMLHRQGSELRDSFTLSDEALDRMVAQCLVRLRNDLPQKSRWTATEAVLLLRALVEPICGPGTAGASIHLAVRRSTAGSNPADQRLTERNWNLFISNLSDVMVSVCGSAAGRLVNRAGFCLALREG